MSEESSKKPTLLEELIRQVLTEECNQVDEAIKAFIRAGFSPRQLETVTTTTQSDYIVTTETIVRVRTDI